jgi:hypothetical protein
MPPGGPGHEATARLTHRVREVQGPGCQPDRTGGRAQRWPTAPCSAGARPCARRNGGPAAAGPRRGPGEERVDLSEHGVAVRPLPNSALVSACVESSVTTASAHGPERAPIGRTKHSSRCGRSIVHPVARRGSAPVYPLIGYLRGSFRPPARVWRTQDVDQRSPCPPPPAHGAQDAQIWTASVVMGIEPTPAQIGGSVRVSPDGAYYAA